MSLKHDKQYHMKQKELLDSFHLDGHTAELYAQT